MKLINFKHNEDYVRFSKELTIKINDLITAEVDIYGGVAIIDSKIFGKVIVLEEPETCPTYYIGGKKTKYDGFKELYNKLFQDDYSDFVDALEKFAENQVLNTFDNGINKLTEASKIKLLEEQIDLLPIFKSDCGRIIACRPWPVNEVLCSLDIPVPSSKEYDRLHEDNSIKPNYGVELSVYQNILYKLLNK